MARITMFQSTLFNKHLEAAKGGSGCFDHPVDSVEAPVTANTLVDALYHGQTVESLWNWCWGKASMTSQLMASPGTFGYYSQAGIKAARDEFKKILNRYNLR